MALEPSLSTQLDAFLTPLSVKVVDRTETSIHVTHLQGSRELAGSVDLSALDEAVRDVAGVRRRQVLASFARGVYQALTDLPLPDGKFTDLAGRLVPRLEYSTFGMALRGSGAQEPWTRPFAGDLSAHYFVELDDGNHMVTADDVARWGATDDRITCAARSLLYHKTTLGEAEAIGAAEAFRLRDGYDAARALALTDLFYHRTQKGMLVAMPEPDLLLFADWSGADEALRAFSDQAKTAFDGADNPLTAEVFTFRAGEVVRVSP